MTLEELERKYFGTPQLPTTTKKRKMKISQNRFRRVGFSFLVPPPLIKTNKKQKKKWSFQDQGIYRSEMNVSRTPNLESNRENYMHGYNTVENRRRKELRKSTEEAQE